MNKRVNLPALGMSEPRDRPKGVGWRLWRRHWHALISAERALREQYVLVDVKLRDR